MNGFLGLMFRIEVIGNGVCAFLNLVYTPQMVSKVAVTAYHFTGGALRYMSNVGKASGKLCYFQCMEIGILRFSFATP